MWSLSINFISREDKKNKVKVLPFRVIYHLKIAMLCEGFLSSSTCVYEDQYGALAEWYWQGKNETIRKQTCPITTSFPINLKRTRLGSNPVIRGDRPPNKQPPTPFPWTYTTKAYIYIYIYIYFIQIVPHSRLSVLERAIAKFYTRKLLLFLVHESSGVNYCVYTYVCVFLYTVRAECGMPSVEPGSKCTNHLAA